MKKKLARRFLVLILMSVLSFGIFLAMQQVEPDKTGTRPSEVLDQFITKYSGKDWLHCFGLVTPIFELQLSQNLNNLTPQEREMHFRQLENTKYKILSEKLDGEDAVLTVSFPNFINAEIRFKKFNRRWKIDSVKEFSDRPTELDDTKIVDSALVTPLARREILIRKAKNHFFFSSLSREDASKIYSEIDSAGREELLKIFWQNNRLKDVFTDETVKGIKETVFKSVYETESLDAHKTAVAPEAKQLLEFSLPEKVVEMERLNKLQGIIKLAKDESFKLTRLRWLYEKYSRKSLPLYDMLWFVDTISLKVELDDKLFAELVVLQHCAEKYSKEPNVPLFGEQKKIDGKPAQDKILSYLKKQIDALKKNIAAEEKDFFKIWAKVQLREKFEQGKRSIWLIPDDSDCDMIFRRC